MNEARNAKKSRRSKGFVATVAAASMMVLTHHSSSATVSKSHRFGVLFFINGYGMSKKSKASGVMVFGMMRVMMI